MTKVAIDGELVRCKLFSFNMDTDMLSQNFQVVPESDPLPREQISYTFTMILAHSDAAQSDLNLHEKPTDPRKIEKMVVYENDRFYVFHDSYITNMTVDQIELTIDGISSTIDCY